MKEIYYGAWKSFYHLEWPVRFLVELIVLLILFIAVFHILKKLGNRFHLKTHLIAGIIFLVTETTYLIGRNSAWVISIDERMKNWGNEVLYGTDRKKKFPWKCLFGAILLLVYLSAVFVDLPVTENLQGNYLAGLMNIKNFFQKYECAASEGFEEYPPLFEWIETEEQEMEKEQTYICLNERGSSGSNIRSTPSMNGEILCEVNSEVEILYQGEWDKDEERCWIKVYIPSDGIEGWLSGTLVDSQQLEEIIF